MTDYIDPTKQTFALFRETDRPGPIHMLNLVKFREKAVYPDGRDVSGAEAYKSYARESGPIFRGLGGKQVWIGKPEVMLIGPQESEQWDIAFIAEYPSVQAFVNMLRDPVYREAAKHRTAGVADSRLLRLEPAAAGKEFGEIE